MPGTVPRIELEAVEDEGVCGTFVPNGGGRAVPRKNGSFVWQAHKHFADGVPKVFYITRREIVTPNTSCKKSVSHDRLVRFIIHKANTSWAMSRSMKNFPNRVSKCDLFAGC